jgi:hypothetical protein
MGAHIFADETKARGFLLAAAIVMPAELAPMRRKVSSLRLPRQRRLRFATERDARRKVIVRALVEAEAHVVLYDATAIQDGKRARDAAIARLADDAAKMGATRLIIERDDSVVAADRKIIRARLLQAGCHGTIAYEHQRAHEEGLLAIPDAVAWCWAKGGHWKTRATVLVSEIVHVDRP